MRINDNRRGAVSQVLKDQMLEQGAFSRARCSDDVHVSDTLISVQSNCYCSSAMKVLS